MQEYSYFDFCNSVNLRELLVSDRELNFLKDSDDDRFVALMNDFCSLIKVYPEYLMFHGTIYENINKIIIDKRWNSSSEEVINSINNFIALYNESLFIFKESILKESDILVKIKEQYDYRFSVYSSSYLECKYEYSSYFPRKKGFISRLFRSQKRDFCDNYEEFVSVSLEELFNLEKADFIVFYLLLQDDVRERERIYLQFKDLGISELMIISSINYVLSKARELILSNINGNLDFVLTLLLALDLDDKMLLNMRVELLYKLLLASDAKNDKDGEIYMGSKKSKLKKVKM